MWYLMLGFIYVVGLFNFVIRFVNKVFVFVKGLVVSIRIFVGWCC